jgi:hypothetical protein
MQHKAIGNKKPLGGLTAETAKPEGAVLLIIVVKYGQLSNIVRDKRLLKLASVRHSRIYLTVTSRCNT